MGDLVNVPCKWKPYKTEATGTIYRCVRHMGLCGPVSEPPDGVKCESVLYHERRQPGIVEKSAIEPEPRTYLDATCLIVTFLRPRKLKLLVDSIKEYYPDAPVVIGDNGRRLPAAPSELAAQLPGCETWVLPFDCGLAASRNFLVSKTTGDVLIFDDDFELTADTNLNDLRTVLNERPDVGIACGHAGFVDPEHIRGWERTHSGVEYCLCTLADNFMLIRREVLDVVRWNDKLKISSEHGPFFEAVAKTPWKVAYVPSVKIQHSQGGDSAEYRNYRHRSFSDDPIVCPHCKGEFKLK